MVASTPVPNIALGIDRITKRRRAGRHRCNHRQTIPGSLVSTPALEYYLEAVDASDEQNVGHSPSNAPATLHSVSISDGSGMMMSDPDSPVIIHTPVADGQEAGQSIAIVATITAKNEIASATLLFRSVGDGSFVRRPMIPSNMDGEYEAEIPGSRVTKAGIEYYIVASDVEGKKASRSVSAPSEIYWFVVDGEQNDSGLPKADDASLRLRGDSQDSAIQWDLDTHRPLGLYGLATRAEESQLIIMRLAGLRMVNAAQNRI